MVPSFLSFLNGKFKNIFFLAVPCGMWLQPLNEKMLAPWKKNYDKPRQCIKKARLHFSDKGPYSQSYAFSSTNVKIGP